MAVGMVGVLVIPFIVNLASVINISPLIIIAGIGVFGFISVIQLEETLNKSLLNNI